MPRWLAITPKSMTIIPPNTMHMIPTPTNPILVADGLLSGALVFFRIVELRSFFGMVNSALSFCILLLLSSSLRLVVGSWHWHKQSVLNDGTRLEDKSKVGFVGWIRKLVPVTFVDESTLTEKGLLLLTAMYPVVGLIFFWTSLLNILEENKLALWELKIELISL